MAENRWTPEILAVLRQKATEAAAAMAKRPRLPCPQDIPQPRRES